MIEACYKTSQDLIDWYWNYGCKRSGRYALGNQWLMDVYRQHDKAGAISHSFTHKKRTLAVWGPSQSGKSTMLSYYIDAVEPSSEVVSALCWPEGATFRFLETKDFKQIDALNPYNGGGDASGCVTRFYATDSVQSATCPVKLTFASRRQSLQAMAAGYIMECKLEMEEHSERFWDEDQINALLGKMEEAQNSREAVELLLDILSVIDRLIEDGHHRYRNLGSKNAWHTRMKRAILGDASYASSYKNAFDFGCELLWDSRHKLKNLFERLENYRTGMEQLFQNLPVLTSLKFSSLLVDIDSFRYLMGRGGCSEEVTRQLNSVIKSVKYRVEDDHILIDIESEGESLFNDIKDFGYFQALIWEMALPLQQDFLQNRSKNIADFLEKFEILDIPGVARQDANAESTRLDLESENVDDIDLLCNVLKRGKTASIINRYAEQMLIDHVLLLNMAGEFPSKPAQLIGGVEAVWHGFDKDYNPHHGIPPVPVTLCLTFMAPYLKNMFKMGRYDTLSSLDTMLSTLGVIKDVCSFFVTTYPHIDDGFTQPLEERITKILPAILEQEWTQKHFKTELEKGSLRALLEDKDGGVVYLLDAIAKLEYKPRQDYLLPLTNKIQQAVTAQIVQALPESDDESGRQKKAVENLISLINHRLDNCDPVREDDALIISKNLRKAFSFIADDFDPFPKQLGADTNIAISYIRNQLNNWVERIYARDALSSLGMNEQEQVIILDLISKTIDINEITEWCMKLFGHVTDDQYSLHIRRYIAAKCTNMAFPKERTSSNRMGMEPVLLEGGDLNKYIFDKFKEWSKPDRNVRNSPHFEAVINPILKRLTQISNSELKNVWEIQPGDDDIENIHTMWNNTGVKDEVIS